MRHQSLANLLYNKNILGVFYAGAYTAAVILNALEKPAHKTAYENQLENEWIIHVAIIK